jgi:hypothetical protein
MAAAVYPFDVVVRQMPLCHFIVFFRSLEIGFCISRLLNEAVGAHLQNWF